MAIILTNKIQFTDASDLTSYGPTNNVDFIAGRLYILSVHGRKIDTTPTPTPSTTGITWTSINGVNFDNIAAPDSRISVYRCMPTSDQLAQGTTIDFGANTMLSCVAVIDEFQGVDTSGSNGAGAIVQAPTGVRADSGTTSPTLTLASFADATNNMAYGISGISSTDTISVEAGWSNGGTVSATPQSIRLKTGYHLGEDTSVVFTTASSRFWGVLGYEIAALFGGNLRQRRLGYTPAGLTGVRLF